MKNVHDIVVNKLKQSKGDLQILEQCASDIQACGAPSYGLNNDGTLAIAIHGWQGFTIYIKDYKCVGNTFSGYLVFDFYDHFGLDNDDYEYMPGFNDWFTLQHYDRFDGAHVPFITSVQTEYFFAGSY